MLTNTFPLRLRGLILSALLGVTGLNAQRLFNRVSQAEPNRTVEFDVFLPAENSDKLNQLLQAQHTKGSPSFRRWLTPQEFQAQFGPNPATLSKIAAELAAHGLSVQTVHSHGLRVSGSVTSVQQTFGVALWHATNAKGQHKLISDGALKMPATMSQAGAVVPAFSSIPPHRMHSRVLGVAPANRSGNAGPYWFTDIKQAYDFPSFNVLTGAGRTIAIVISSDVLDSDLALYFGHEQLAVPKLVRIPILGGSGPADPSKGAIFEASLDVQQAGGMAPNATIDLYDIPDLSDNSILAAYQTIVDDNTADIVSSSFGGPELSYTAAYNSGIDQTYLLRIYHEILRQASVQGITFVASSGDNGAYNTPSVDGTQYVLGIDSPADDPNVTAVGGTNLVTSYQPGSLDSTYIRENAFYDVFDPAQGGLPNEIWGSGGGKSIIFGKPAFQKLVDTGSDTRAIPDISLQMGGCPVGSITPCASDRSAVVTVVNGQGYLLIGTSVSAPEFAGLLALEEEYLGIRLGNINNEIYVQAAAQQLGVFNSFHQGIPGDNGAYQSKEGQTGYNLVVGNGTPIGINFILDPYAPVAGTPQTGSNP